MLVNDQNTMLTMLTVRTDKIRRSGLATANPQVPEPQLSPEQAEANRQRFAASLKQLSGKLKAGTLEVQNEEKN
jgi:hypothetical protein